MVEFATIFAGVLTGVLRNAAGWLENASAETSDGGRNITPYEWGQLGATVIRVLMLTLGAAYGLGLEPVAAAGSALFADFIISALKAKKK